MSELVGTGGTVERAIGRVGVVRAESVGRTREVESGTGCTTGDGVG